MLYWALIFLALTLEAPEDHNVLIANETGLLIARIEIDDKRLEKGSGAGGGGTDKILIKVSPEKHHLRVVFVGGADVDWHDFDFKGVHEIAFTRAGNKIEARVE